MGGELSSKTKIQSRSNQELLKTDSLERNVVQLAKQLNFHLQLKSPVQHTNGLYNKAKT